MRIELRDPLTLPCGATVPNRLVKAAMSEALGTRDNRVTPQMCGSTSAGQPVASV